MGKENGGPAFPRSPHSGDASDDGMTLRDYFAAKASDQDVSFQGEILREQIARSKGIGVLPDEWRVTARYMHADAMLAARENSNQNQKSDADGWIEWNGGECPVEKKIYVEVKYADGTHGTDVAGSIRWNWIFSGANGGDIIAYRIVKEGGVK